jgi:hypothetical protein
MKAVRMFATAAVLAAVATATIGTAASAAQIGTATAPTAACVGATYTTHVVNRPDSSSHGDWAKDTFTRTTAVICIEGGYRVNLTDVGTFAPLPGAVSPAAGVPIHNLPFTGQFTGGTSFTVKTADKPVNPVAGASGKFSSSEWAKLVFPEAKDIVQGGWGWTYSHCGESWKNQATGNVGDITGVKPCHPAKPTTTSPAPSTSATPTTSAPAPTTSTKPVVVVSNPGQFQTVPNVTSGVATGDGSLS